MSLQFDYHAEMEMFDFPFDLGNDLYDIDVTHPPATIKSDLERIRDVDRDLQVFGIEGDMKSELRHSDCMWPAMANCLSGLGNVAGSGGNSAASSYSETSAIPLAVVSGAANPYSPYQRSQVADGHNIQQAQLGSSEDMPVIIKKELLDQDYTVGQKRRRLSGGDKKAPPQDEDQLIPPGGSLLRKRNLGVMPNRKYLRPDTPLSLADEVVASEFRHNVDLRACVMGSNNISLSSDDGDVSCINQISRDLQSAGKDQFTVRFPIPPINDVLDVLNQQANAGQQPQGGQAIDEQHQAIHMATGSSTVGSPPTTGSDSDSDEGEVPSYGLRLHRSSKGTHSSGAGSSTSMLHMLHISDHSYTRCNDDGPNLETPSDSDEEIDVVTYTDKKLPTNPSCHVMGALQTKMAHKISVDHMKQKSRYANFNLPYTPASSSPVKSVANSRYPSPSSTPHQHCASASPSYSPQSVESSNVSSVSSSSSSSQSSFGSSGVKGRKRSCLKGPGAAGVAATGTATASMALPINSHLGNAPVGKKCRGKKAAAGCSSASSASGSMSPGSASAGQEVEPFEHSWQRRSGVMNAGPGGSSGVMRKEFGLGLDEADTIEKRNQHNDMERQRRIGLKNLFEALKKQIPTIRDKERAPKVNILREAAKLCTQLTQEEHELSLQRQLLAAKLKKLKETLVWRSRMVKSEPHPVSG
ncbi:myc protein [Drosophila ficusphila]|uniref:myc protein n=1 Tax=Drosophila ficusphila TaxID=30025 RepID=UPI0007E70C62|nr:myc protein [Drosophila ficusphila]